jgi:1-acyl-sn-glycerol-3-phosphate acyltransferase
VKRRVRATLRTMGIGLASAILYFVFIAGRLVFRGLGWRNRMVRAWARSLARCFGMRVTVEGTPPAGGFLMVSNHVGYVDILLLSQFVDVAFIAKSEVRDWPGLGVLASSVGTIFIDRASRRDAVRVKAVIDQALSTGLGVLLFPEGTSGDGRDVLPFKPALLDGAARSGLPVHYAAITYAQPEVAWVGDITLVPHAWTLLQLPHIDVKLQFCGTVVASDRKELADRLWREIRARVVAEAETRDAMTIAS